ncbi:MAG: methyl-accepting chemotaxis protein, partial [Spirochaetota bacterium]
QKQLLLQNFTREAQLDFKKQVQEWKNTLLRGFSRKDFRKYLKKFKKSHQAVQQKLEYLKRQFPDARTQSIQKQIQVLQTVHLQLFQQYTSALSLFEPDDPLSPRKVDKAVRGIDREPTEKFADITITIGKYSLEESHRIRRELIFFLLGLLLLCVLILILLAVWVIRGVTVPIDQLLVTVKAMEVKDFSKPIVAGSGQNEISRLTQSLQKMEENMVRVLALIQTTSQKTTSLTAHLSENSANFRYVANRLSEYSLANTEKVVEVKNEMKVVHSSMDRVSRYSRETEDMVSLIMDYSNHLGSLVDNLKNVSHEFSNHTERGKGELHSLKDNLSHLNTTFQEMETIIKNISQFSRETSMLALNASIEASRAGEEGEGFMVVAEQVSNLASKTQSNVHSILNFSHAIREKYTSSISNIQSLLDLLEAIFASGKEIYDFVGDVSDRTNHNTSILLKLLGNLKTLEELLVESRKQVDESTKHAIEIEKKSQQSSEEANKVLHGAEDIENLSKDIDGQVSQLEGILAEFRLKA